MYVYCRALRLGPPYERQRHLPAAEIEREESSVECDNAIGKLKVVPALHFFSILVYEEARGLVKASVYYLVSVFQPLGCKTRGTYVHHKNKIRPSCDGVLHKYARRSLFVTLV